MTHGEKMARAALLRWIKLLRELDACSECTAAHEQCHRHSPKIRKLVEDSKRVLASGPN